MSSSNNKIKDFYYFCTMSEVDEDKVLNIYRASSPGLTEIFNGLVHYSKFTGKAFVGGSYFPTIPYKELKDLNFNKKYDFLYDYDEEEFMRLKVLFHRLNSKMGKLIL